MTEYLRKKKKDWLAFWKRVLNIVLKFNYRFPSSCSRTKTDKLFYYSILSILNLFGFNAFHLKNLCWEQSVIRIASNLVEISLSFG